MFTSGLMANFQNQRRAILPKNGRKKLSPISVKQTISDIFWPKKTIPSGKNTVKCEILSFSTNSNFLKIRSRRKAARNQKCFDYRLFWALAIDLLAKNTSEMVYFTKTENILFGHFLAKQHILAFCCGKFAINPLLNIEKC